MSALSVILALALFGCGHSWILIDGVKYSKEISRQRLDSYGVEQRRLIDDGRVQEILFQGGTDISFYRHGQVALGTLGEDTTIQEMSFKAGTRIEFHLKELIGIEDSGAKATTNRSPPRGATRFPPYVDALVKEGTLAADANIKGHVLRRETVVRFHENGNLSTGVLAHDSLIHNVKWRAAKWIWSRERNGPVSVPVVLSLFANGGVQSGVLAEDTELRYIWFRALTDIEFYEDGRVKSGFLNRETRVDGVSYLGWERIQFDARGRVQVGTLASGAKLREACGTPECWFSGFARDYPAESTIEFNERGEVVFSVPASQEDPSQLRVTLSKSALIGGTRYEAGTRLWISKEDGRVKSSFVESKNH